MTQAQQAVRLAAGRSGEPRNRLWWLIVPVVVFFLVFLVYPLVRILYLSFFDPGFTLEHYARFFTQPAYFNVLLLTIKTGLLVTVLCLILGYPVAYLLANVSDSVRNLLMIFVLLPFWTSFLVRTYAWIVILQKQGIVNQILTKLGLIDAPMQLVHNSIGVTIGLTHVMLPFMILPLYSIMKGIDQDLVKSAQSLGASPLQTFLRVYFPLSLPGVASGSILVFVISIGYYVTPALLGGRKDTMISQLIAEQISGQLNWGFGSAIAVVLLVIVLAMLYLFNRIFGLDKMSFGA